jgi:hypothetical protein
MRYNGMTGFTEKRCHVILPEAALIEKVMIELQNAPLFNKQIRVEKITTVKYLKPTFRLIDLSVGWYASESPDVQHIKLREALTTYPSDIFGPLREGRRVTLDNIPGDSAPRRRLYEIFHGLNILGINRAVKYVPIAKWMSGWVSHVDSETREEAEDALLCNGSVVVGHKIIVAPTKIPLKYTISWGQSRPSGHNRTDKDRGSAVGTNFEEMQELQCKRVPRTNYT